MTNFLESKYWGDADLGQSTQSDEELMADWADAGVKVEDVADPVMRDKYEQYLKR